MKTVVSLTVSPGDEGNEGLLRKKAAESIGVPMEDITGFTLEKRSVDARRGRAKIVLRYALWTGEEPPQAASPAIPRWKRASGDRRVVIVGAGPAGLFAGLRLLEAGVTPVILEQGKRTGERRQDIAAIGVSGQVDRFSNYCFGEGGAGAFSDGKLFSRSNKRGDIGRILAILHHFGADPSILTGARPHIGTDKLPPIITALTDRMMSLGAEFFFQAHCTGFLLDREARRVAGVRARRLSDNAGFDLPAEGVILAPGHSSPEMYRLAQEAAESLWGGGGPPALEAKTFAWGLRVEHPRKAIDSIQYRGTRDRGGLAAAEYRLAAQIDGRGVYTFCMCPGGIVVPAASGPGEIVVNGMSPSGRNSRWSNAGIVCETLPEDCAAMLRPAGTESAAPGSPGPDPFVSLAFRRMIEKRAFEEGDGQRAPAQRLVDFLEARQSTSLPESSYRPGLVSSRLDQWLPAPAVNRLQAAFREFGRVMRGFVCEEALLIAPETRTSSPARILRDEHGESRALPGLFPCGEGSGYAGGIVSSAMDGERAAGNFCAKA